MSQQPPQGDGQPWNNPQQPPNYSQPLYGPPPQQPLYPQQPPTFYPPQQPGYPQQQAPYPQPGQHMPVQPPPKKQRKSLKEQWNSGKSGKCGVIAVVGILLLVVGLCSGVMHAATSGTATTQDTPTVTPHQQSTAASQPAAVAPVKSVTHYPPKTKADLDGLAAQGDASAIHEFHSESTGLTGACPQPKREVTVDPALTGQKLAEDLLAYFYQNQLDSPCGSLVLAYHTQSEANDVYTAGRINFDATDASGSVNFDPNASNLKYTLTLDTGSALANQEEYAVSY